MSSGRAGGTRKSERFKADFKIRKAQALIPRGYIEYIRYPGFIQLIITRNLSPSTPLTRS